MPQRKTKGILITHIAQPDLERYTVHIYSIREKPHGQSQLDEKTAQIESHVTQRSELQATIDGHLATINKQLAQLVRASDS